ncbi:MAG TPA: Crp/Fnr family transcriptional regulator [Sphingopyxis sp.]|uniref:Crp/Fnr family transcriptional regulator n=1 Tax=Sphingopyxis sp. TaxID=1908224 RepID=UPI002BB77A07|nr:Crp/Fnr family transcriptional regulator [Sphingopyxis sp.]HWW57930.1 Crp/Fnr family transcriptional regulator [Sphingopyxis sp.]
MHASTDEFFEKVSEYASLDAAAREAWQKLLVKQDYRKNEHLVVQGQPTRNIFFVESGLLLQYHVGEGGEAMVKRFFLERSFAASTSALLTEAASDFSIRALEPVSVWAYDFRRFKDLVRDHRDIANFYIGYMERHWVVEKEPLEISFRNDDARRKYARFLEAYPGLEKRIRQHEVAAFLGITPTQLSRIRSGRR